MHDLKTIFSFILFSFFGLCLNAQSINTSFGKNRVQYHNDFTSWTRYETENFITYWYGKSRNIAQPVVQMAELDHDEVQQILEHTISDKIEIIVYIDISDLKQSNIGLEESFTSKTGKTKINGNKMFVYFDGNHLNLRKQIRQGIAEVYLSSIIYGSSFQEIVQNALLLNLPEWFKEGIVAYSGSKWDYEIDDELRELLDYNPKFYEFQKLAKEHPRVAGHSMWNFIAQNYGESTIANIIYLTRINRNLENSFLFILGDDFKTIENDWSSFLESKYDSETDNFTLTDSLNEQKLKNKKGVPISHMKLSPNGKLLAYVTNHNGKAKVYVRDLENDSEKMIFKNSYKNFFQATDYNYPLIAWHPQIPELSIIYEHRDVIKQRKIFVPDEEYEDDVLTQDFQRIYSLEYLDGEKYLMTASKDGYSDLYIYNTRLRSSERLTEDYYDDLDARPIIYEGEQSVLFSSNRTTTKLERNRIDTILPLDQFDLFILKGLGKEKSLIQLTATPEVSEIKPQTSSSNDVFYLKESSGILNAYSINIYNKSITPVTNLERNIIIHNKVPNSNKYFFSYYDEGRYKVFLKDYDRKEKVWLKKTNYYATEKPTEDNEVLIPFMPIEEEEEVITEGQLFQSEFSDPVELMPIESYVQKGNETNVFSKYFKDYYSGSVQDGKRVIKYSPMRANASRVKFRLADFTTKLDNSVLFEGLESYAGDDKELNNVPMGILFKGTIKDLFEDYDIQVGVRLPTSFNGYEYFFVFDDKKSLIDRRFAVYRKSETSIIDPTAFPIQREKRHTILGMYQIKYPFDIYNSLRLTGSLRLDKYLSVVVDAPTLNAPKVNEKRLSLKAEYIFDNSFDVSTNIKNGTRAKVFMEGINQFNLELSDGFNIDPSKGITGVLGFDARHYIPIFKQAVFALRATGATSFGSNRIVYYLGGVENWLFNKFDNTIPLPPGNDFSYKVLAPHLRGFKNNIRNGNSYALTNAELRVPIFRFLSKKPEGNSFFKNFQITGFFDAGLAWYGIGPNAEDNPLNTIEVSNPMDNPVITVNARYFRDPLVMGYGFGFRSNLLGYFIKFDYAWGIETGVTQDPRMYLSLGTDF